MNQVETKSAWPWLDRSRIRLLAGGAIWSILGIIGAWYLARDIGSSQTGTARQVARYLLAPRHRIELEFPSPQKLRVAESIFERRGDEFVRIGEIVAIRSLSGEPTRDGWTQHAVAEIYSSAQPIRSNDELTYIPSTESMQWVVASMLTAERRATVQQLLREAYFDHRQELTAHFRPLIEATLREAATIIWEDLQAIVPEYDEQWQRVGERYRNELVDRRLVPLLRNEIWPIVVRKSSPLVNQIGEEIWDRTSIWRFGWRAMYDVLPLPQRDLTRAEFERFVETDAIPVLQAHLLDLFSLQQVILAEVSRSPQVQAEIVASLQHVMADEEVQKLVTDMLQRVVVNNPRLNAVLTDIWNSPRAQAGVDLANQRLEFTIAAIGEELFGNPHTAITPEFSRVLRFKVLHKDCQWLVLERGSAEAQVAASIDVRIGLPTTDNPFHIPAEARH